MAVKNALYAQSGGVTAVINATACGVIETARKMPGRIGKVYAARNGVIGTLVEDLIDTTHESPAAIRSLWNTPAAAYGSCRYELPDPEQSPRHYERLLEVCRAHNIGYFLYNGGNGSADIAHKIGVCLPRMGYPIVSIGIPKTIDNDIAITDCSPGFGSAAKYAATSMREAAADVASMAATSTKVFVLELMGRHSGWITAACGLAWERGQGPHLLLLPEIPFDRDGFLARVRTMVEKHGYCAVAAAEGLKTPDGEWLSQAAVSRNYGHEQLGGVAPIVAELIRSELHYKVHWSVVDYLQRSARHLASLTDLKQSYAVGRAAVQLAAKGRSGVMPVIVRESSRPYRWRIGTADLQDIANKEKMVPRDFITENGFHITEKCRRYLAPLIEGEDLPPFRNGLPVHAKLKNVKLRKKLRGGFEV